MTREKFFAPGWGIYLLKKTLKISIQIAVSLLCVFYALRGVDFARLVETLSGYAMWPVALSLVPCFANLFIMSARIDALCGRKAGFWGAFRATVVGQGLNNVLPAKGGDVAKIVYLSQTPGVTAAEAAGAVIVERFFDANCLFVLAVTMLRRYIPSSALIGAGGVFFTCWAIFFLCRFYPARFEQVWIRLPWLAKIKFLDSLKQYLLYEMSARQLAVGALSTVGSWCSYCAYTVIAFLCVGNFDMSLADAFAAFIISAAGQLVPSSPGSLGVLEASFGWGLWLFGVGREAALGIAFFVRAAQFLPTLGVPIVFMNDAARKIRRG
jgi:uncharacterized protein (TIRG00374 family)